MGDLLLAQIHQVVQTLPPLALATLTHYLSQLANTPPDVASQQILRQLPNPVFRRQVQDLLALWQSTTPLWNSVTLAAALQASAYSYHQTHQALEVELVWTGPEAGQVPLRRTEQVFLQLIRNTEVDLTLISFAVYKIPTIVQALKVALHRGVRVRAIAEIPETTEKIPFGITTVLNPDLLKQIELYVWSREHRLVDDRGREGLLHIKGAIADHQQVFITSANLTEYALTLNMEMGLLVHSSDLAAQIAQVFNRLIQQGTLIRYQQN